MNQNLVKLRKELANEMFDVYAEMKKHSAGVSDGLETLAALRHLHDVVCRELDYADLETGLDSYALDLLHGLDNLADHPAYGQPVRQAANHCRQLFGKLFPEAGVK